jgi:hypothetical protein
MNSIKGFVYGHYDSRGGTTMIVADTREEADKVYLLDIFGYDEGEAEEFGARVCAEDFMYEAELHFPEGTIVFGSDLEWGEDGMVLTPGPNKPEDFNFEAANDYNREVDPYEPEGPAMLEFVPKDGKPQMIKNWSHPHWDDDAYSFHLHSRFHEIGQRR